METVPVWLAILFASIGALGAGAGIVGAAARYGDKKIQESVTTALNDVDGPVQRIIVLERKIHNGITERLDEITGEMKLAAIERQAATAGRAEIREALARVETELKYRFAERRAEEGE